MAEKPVLPKNVDLTYLNEGAANIVYRISVPSSRPRTPQPSALEEYGEGTPPPSEIDPEELEQVRTITVTRIHASGTDKAMQDSSSSLVFDGKSRHVTCLFSLAFVLPTCQRLSLTIPTGKLLRVRKNLPTTLPCAVSQENWLKLIAPLFSPDQVVEQSLVQLTPGDIIPKLNSELRTLETESNILRSAKRRGTYLADDEYGLLVTDMTPGRFLVPTHVTSTNQISGQTSDEVYEFKPKWLLQSPSAPEDVIRCRQCARNAKENTTRKSQGLPYKKFFCPLDLVSDDPRAVSLAASLMADTPDQTERIKHWLQTNTLIKDLRRLQSEM
jgi:inositol-pentakisphosphate 2-kinase